MDTFRTLVLDPPVVEAAVRAARPTAGAWSRGLKSKQLDELVDREVRIVEQWRVVMVP